MRFFLRKQIIKFSCTSWSLLLCKINKKTWEQIQRYEDVILFLFPNNQIALNKTSFQKTINIIPMSLLAYFIVQNCKTIFTVDPELWGRMHILVPEWHICSKQKIFGKTINTTSMHFISPIYCEIVFKKTIRANPELWWYANFWPKMTHFL